MNSWIFRIVSFLKILKVEMTGSSVFDYVHHQDHAEIAEQLGLGLASNQSMASPSSGISEDGGANQGTNNPDGNFDHENFLISNIF